jgi:hypothetical protein
MTIFNVHNFELILDIQNFLHPQFLENLKRHLIQSYFALFKATGSRKVITYPKQL